MILVEMRTLVLSLTLLASGFARAAIGPDGTQVLGPVSDGDPSPIADINTYYPDQHDCPLPCTDYTNIHSWITYFSTKRVRRCSRPMYDKNQFN